jgi:tetratricopeptide (TPR) repeat protein
MSTVSSSDEMNAQASVLMKQGIRLLDGGSAAEALPFFERALELRRQLPVSNPIYAFGLAACWLNHGEALSRQGGTASVAKAIRSYDAGISALQTVPLDTDPRFPRRLAIGHQNRGLLLLSQGRVDAAIADLHTAVGVLEQPGAAAIDDRQYLLAAVWLNIAMARASSAEHDAQLAARHAALRAVDLVADGEVSHASYADVGLRARHVISRTLIETVARTSAQGEALPHDVHETTDIVDEGLRVAREWERQGDPQFRQLACDLLRFGARVYAIHQPRHLEEFISENVDPSQSSHDYVSSEEIRFAVEEARRLQRPRSGN